MRRDWSDELISYYRHLSEAGHVGVKNLLRRAAEQSDFDLEAFKAEHSAAKVPVSKPAPAAPEPTPDFPVSVGGGYYELSDGSRVQGKDAAQEAQSELDG